MQVFADSLLVSVPQVKNTTNMMQTTESPGKSAGMDGGRSPWVENKQSESDCLTIRTYDGRFITRVSVGTQTDSRQKDEFNQDCKPQNKDTPKSPQKTLWLLSTEKMHHKDSLQQPVDNESVLKNMKPEMEISPDNEMLNLLSKETPRAPTACEEGTEETLNNLDKIAASGRAEEPLHAVSNVCSEKSQQPEKTPVTCVLIANSVDPKEIVCSEKSCRTSGTLTETTSDETVTERGSAMGIDQRRHRLKGLESKEDSNGQTPEAGPSTNKQTHTTPHDLPLNDALIPEQETDCGSTFSFNIKDVRMKGTMPLVKHYKNGKIFTMIFADGTGQLCYPSGRLAILVAAAQTADWSCVVVLEDKENEPCIQAIFTNRGHSTCYHKNGSIWVNLTSWGGICCKETGVLKKHWSWLDNQHVHAPPCQPLSLSLSPNVNIRIKSQEDICITFTSDKGSIQLSKEAKLKLNKSKDLMMPGPDLLQRYLSQKSEEINVLLQNIQSLVTYQKAAGPQKVKLQRSLISQMERRRLPVKQQHSAKKTPQS